MLKIYVNLAWRNLLKNKGYAFINISGLAIGLTAFLLILLYVNYETGYDQWDPQLERVYRIGVDQIQNGEQEKFVWSAYPLGNQIMENCPEAEAVTRVKISPEQSFSVNQKSFYEKRVIAADSSFFTVFPHQFLYGNAESAMSQRDAVVISSQVSRKLFGDTDPVGKIIELKMTDDTQLLTISGVFEKSGTSHLDFDYCLSYFNKNPGSWSRSIFTTYVLLKKDASLQTFAPKVNRILLQGNYLRSLSFAGKPTDIPAPGTAEISKWMRDEKISKSEILFEPVAQIHLNPQATGWRGAFSLSPVDDYAKGNRLPVIIFSVAGLLILVLACINYTNLSVAQAGKRAKEAGMRKVLGSSRTSLIFQFLSEAFLQCTLALLLALFFVRIALVFFNASFGLQLSFWNPVNDWQNLFMLLQLSGIITIVTLISGVYPAFFLSKYQAVHVLKGDTLKGAKGKVLRNGLIVTQFVISVAFISAMTVIYRQVSFMRDNDPGFNTEQVLAMRVRNWNMITPGEDGEQIDYLKSKLSGIKGVQDIAIADAYPGKTSLNIQEAGYNGQSTALTFTATDFNYFKLFGMKVIKGRDFSPSLSSDSVDAAVINETAVRKMRLKKPIGTIVGILGRDYRVIGVLKDNLNDGYMSEVQPTIYAIGAQKGLLVYDKILLKIKGKEASATVASITKFWQTVEPGFPLQYDWVDESFAGLINKHEKLGKLSLAFTIISMLIAVMGIFALTAFTAEQRKKEIGIRKVFGASVGKIVALLSIDFLKLVLVAVLIAFPIAWYMMNTWLQDFAYRIEITWWMFALSGSIAVLIAFLTVSFQAVKAASLNPVKSLRSE